MKKTIRYSLTDLSQQKELMQTLARVRTSIIHDFGYALKTRRIDSATKKDAFEEIGIITQRDEFKDALDRKIVYVTEEYEPPLFEGSLTPIFHKGAYTIEGEPKNRSLPSFIEEELRPYLC